MQAEFYRSEYEKIICSACPFTKGVDAFYSNRGRNYPCKVASGTAGLINDKICGMVAWGDWTETHLFKRVAEKGKGALEKFKAKQAALKAAV